MLVKQSLNNQNQLAQAPPPVDSPAPKTEEPPPTDVRWILSLKPPRHSQPTPTPTPPPVATIKPPAPTLTLTQQGSNLLIASQSTEIDKAYYVTQQEMACEEEDQIQISWQPPDWLQHY